MAAHHPTVPGVTFKDIEGYPGYCVGDDGSVWSYRLRGRRRAVQIGAWLPMKPRLQKSGHLNVNLSHNGNRCTRWVHRLVLEAFVGPCPEGMEACHFPDRNPGNNRLENLRWDTRAANFADMIAHGTKKLGERIPTAKLRADDVREIRRLHLAGVYYYVIAKKFGVSTTAIRLVVIGRTWTHV